MSQFYKAGQWFYDWLIPRMQSEIKSFAVSVLPDYGGNKKN